MTRFAVLRHAVVRHGVVRHSGPEELHFDLLLEMGQTLKTWALPQSPESGVEMACEALPDHRPMYLDYEGPVSGDRGSVTRWDRGTYRILHQSERKLVVCLDGEKLTGRAVLEMTPEDPQRWRFSFTAE